MREFLAVSYLFSPLLVGLTAHGFCIKFDCLKSFSRPLDGGQTFRGERLFGANKTYRGLTAVGLGTALGFGLQASIFHNFAAIRQIELFEYSLLKAIILGFTIGLAAMLSELPNSFIKRQLNIAPGAVATDWRNFLLYVFDQVDLLIGTWLILIFVVETTLTRVFYSFVFLFVSHQILSSFGYLLGMRKTAR